MYPVVNNLDACDYSGLLVAVLILVAVLLQLLVAVLLQSLVCKRVGWD